MGLVDKTLTSDDFAPYLVENLPNNPGAEGWDALSLKKRFDYIATHVIRDHINGIIADLVRAEENTGGKSGAQYIGSAAIAGLEGANTVWEQIVALYAFAHTISTTALDEIPIGAVTDDKLASVDQSEPPQPQLKARFATHEGDPAAHIITGVTGGTASSYTLDIGARTWASLCAKPLMLLVRPHVTCAANALVKIGEDGQTCQIRPAIAPAGGVEAGQMVSGGQYLLAWSPSNSQLYLLNPETRSHSHAIANVTSLQATLDGKAAASHTQDWSTVTGKPSSFTPSSHNHDGTTVYVNGSALNDVYNWLVGLINGKSSPGHQHDWNADIVNKPGTYAPSPHGHALGDSGMVVSWNDPGHADGKVWLKLIGLA